jgi:enterochelin esterase-like enzyme
VAQEDTDGRRRERWKSTLMRITLLVLAESSMLVCPTSPARAQEPAGGSMPASSNAPHREYPRIDSELRATFQLAAPDAEAVQVSVGGDSYEMTRNAEGMWTVTTPPLVPGFHYYSLVIDGVSFADPNSQSFFGSTQMMSGIEVPAPDQDFYAVRDVPHGEVRSHWYHSEVTGEWRRSFVYTPPGYDENPDQRYPVLYLQHGYGEDARGWPIQGRMNLILDNLIADGRALPMILVAEDGGIAGGLPPRGSRLRQGFDLWSLLTGFEEIMIRDIVPEIDSTYRTIADRDHRAMAGLSMGGGQTFLTTFHNLDTFAYIGGFSPAVPQAEFDRIIQDPEGFNERVKVLFLGTGTVERDTNPNILRLHEALDSAGVRNVYYESPGTAHEWLTWRRDLYQFTPLLFRD